MKKCIHLVLFLCLGYFLQAQTNNLAFAGTVTFPDGTPAQGVTISIDVFISNVNAINVLTTTGPNGNYDYIFELPAGVTSGIYNVAMHDCLNFWNVVVGTYQAGNGGLIVHNFTYCEFGPNGSCSVSINMDSTAIGIVELTALPVGLAPFTYQWSNGQTSQSIPFQPNGLNYCVTVTDANGCAATACVFNPPPPGCSVTIQTNPAFIGLTAVATGAAPYTYVWSNGATTPNLLPNAPGSYCITVTDANGCVASDCFWYSGGGGGQDSCSVAVSWDSLPNGGLSVTAYPIGTAPFTYVWSNLNVMGQTVNVPGPGTYCVTVTDATGCQAFDCITITGNPNDCWVEIVEGNVSLFAIVPGPGYAFQWNTGATTQSIIPTSSGIYCVTVFQLGATCTSTACYDYQGPVSYNINGYIYFPDSMNVQGPIPGTVELYAQDNNSNGWYLFNTVNIQNDPAGFWNYYNFGQVPAGQYLIKAVPDPSWPFYGEYLPTYHINTIYWDEAQIATVPSSWGFFSITLSDGQNLLGGNGGINGLVTEGDGLTANGQGTRGGGPLEGVSVLLLDSQEKPITHTLTNAQGEYSFGNLPFGTYKIVVEITGKEQGERWVTLSPENPVSNGNNFNVGENEVTITSLSDLTGYSDFQVFPNPAKDELHLFIEATTPVEANITFGMLTGQSIFTEKRTIVPGSQRISFNLGHLPAGVYILQVNTGNSLMTKKVVKE